MIDDFPSRKMTEMECARLTLSIHHSKQDLKQRWKNLSPEFRKSIREEWGEYLNNSYPFEANTEVVLEFIDDCNYLGNL